MGTGKSKLVALDAATGAVRWQPETPKEWTIYRPLMTGSIVIVGNDDENLCAFDDIAHLNRTFAAPVHVVAGAAIDIARCQIAR